MDSIYQDGTYLSNNKSWHVEDAPWKGGHIARMLEKSGIHFQTICEVGCGAGEVLNQLSLRYPAKEFCGYEISPQAYELCSMRERSGLHFYKDNLLALNVTYDVCLCIDVFEHVEDYYGFLKALRTKSIYKVFHIPLDISVQSVLRATPLMSVRKSVGHIHYFTKETALATLFECGYQIIDQSYTAATIDRPSLSWKAALMKLPRRVVSSISPDLAARILGGFSLLVLAR